MAGRRLAGGSYPTSLAYSMGQYDFGSSITKFGFTDTNRRANFNYHLR